LQKLFFVHISIVRNVIKLSLSFIEYIIKPIHIPRYSLSVMKIYNIHNVKYRFRMLTEKNSEHSHGIESVSHNSNNICRHTYTHTHTHTYIYISILILCKLKIMNKYIYTLHTIILESKLAIKPRR